MKIALIDPSLFTWPYDDALASALEQNGHTVVVYGKYLAQGQSAKSAPHYRELFYPGLHHPKMQELSAPFLLALKGIMHFFSLIALKRELKRLKPDIIHFQWAPLPVVDKFFISAFRRIAPTILTVHDSMPFNANPRSKLQQLSALTIMRYFDHLIVHTEQAKKRLSTYGLSSSRIAHGPLYANISVPNVVSEITKDDKITLLLFGKLKPYKGVDILIHALAALPSHLRLRYCLHIVGQAQMDVSALYALAKEKGVAANIIWDLRFVPDTEMGDIFAKSDIIVMPYREIDASGVLMIAIDAEKPIIASRIGLFAEMLEDGKHGYLIAPQDAQALSKAIAALIENKEHRLRMGKEIRKLKNSIPRWHSIAKITEALYHDIREKIPN